MFEQKINWVEGTVYKNVSVYWIKNRLLDQTFALKVEMLIITKHYYNWNKNKLQLNKNILKQKPLEAH